MGIANIINNSTTTSGGEIVRELVNSSDGAGLNFADGGKIELANSAAAEFGTSDFSLEFVLNQTGDNTSDNYIYTSHTPGNNRFYVWNDISANKVNLEFVDGSGSATTKVLDYDMAADYGTPTHYVIAFDRSGNATLYKNGNSVATVDISSTSSIDIGAGNTNVGALAAGAGYGVLGTFYRFRTWNKALTSAEVQTAYERADVPVADQYGSQTEKVANSGLENWNVANTVPDDWPTFSAGSSAIARSSDAASGSYSAQLSVDSSNNNVYINTSAVTLPAGKTIRYSVQMKGSAAIDKVSIYALGDNVMIAEPALTTSYQTFTGTYTATADSRLLLGRNAGGNGASKSIFVDNASVVQIGCVSDYQTQWANPSQSLTVQDASGAADGTCSASGVTQVQPVVQLNSTSARIGTSAATPADGELLVSGNLGVGCDPAATLHANSSANGVNAIIENSTHNTQFLIKASAANKNSEILFGDSAADDVGKIDYDHNDNSLKLNTNSATRLTIDSSGNVSIAGSADPYSLSGDGAVNQLSVHATGTNKSASLNLASTGTGWNGISLGNETIRRAFVGTLNGSHLVFYTNNTNSGTTVAERMRISSTGHVSMTSSDADAQLTLTGTGTNAPAKIDLVPQGTGNARIQVGGSDKITIASTGLATFSNGIAFSQTDTSATGATATGTTLDHYEEGTWTPVPKDNQATVVATSTALGRYVRVGKIVTCTYRLVRNDTQSLTNTLYLYGLPFPSQNNVQTKNIGGGTSWFPNDTYAGFNYALENTDKWIIRKNDATGYATTNVWSNGQELIGTIIYEADA